MTNAVHSISSVERRTGGAGWLSAVSGRGIQGLLAIVVVDAFLEDWLLMLGSSVGSADAVPLETVVRLLRNLAYIALAAATGVRILSTVGLRAFIRPVDLALLWLAIVLLIAGIAGGSSPTLIAHGVFIYLRGAILYYAIRALRPDWLSARPFVLLAAGLLAVHLVVAFAQGAFGPVVAELLGVGDLRWTNANRAQGLFSHPNHLGHVVGLAMLLAVAWRLPNMDRRSWLLLLVLATGLALAQSRESLVGVTVGVVGMGYLARASAGRVGLVLLLIATTTAVVWTLQPGSWDALAHRIKGVIGAVEVPSGASPDRPCDPTVHACSPGGTVAREVRVLYYQQGLRLWLASPVVGYGVGQFGGGVASQHDPDWHRDPRFGPGGFNMHGFPASQVDSYWLHLTVETGALGLSAYVLWFLMLGYPAAKRTREKRATLRRRDHRSDHDAAPLPGPEVDAGVADALDRFVPAGLVFAIVIAGLSPALEDHIFAPLLFAALGLGWALRPGRAIQPIRAVGARSQQAG